MTDEEVKDFAAINCSEYFKSTKEEQNNTFLTTPDEAENYVKSKSSDNCIHHYNVKILSLFDPELID